MVYKYKQFLGNTNTTEVHDTQQEQTGCRLDEIKEDHKRWFDTLAAAHVAGFDNCAHCLGNSRR